MYCPTCGTAQTVELSYCSRCGADLTALTGRSKPKALEKSIETIIWSIVGVTLSSLGIMIAVMALMIGAEIAKGFIVLFMSVMFLVLLGIDGLFLWQLSRLRGRAKELGRAFQLGKNERRELGAHREQALDPGSVTENTTRVLEAQFDERRRN